MEGPHAASSGRRCSPARKIAAQSRQLCVPLVKFNILDREHVLKNRICPPSKRSRMPGPSVKTGRRQTRRQNHEPRRPPTISPPEVHSTSRIICTFQWAWCVRGAFQHQPAPTPRSKPSERITARRRHAQLDGMVCVLLLECHSWLACGKHKPRTAPWTALKASGWARKRLLQRC